MNPNPLVDFLAPGAALPAGTLVLDNTADVMADAEGIHRHAAVALRFPRWTDGRAYSQGVLLRGRLRYAGTVIATGDVLADMLPLLRRCGFDAVQLRADQRLETAQRALGFFDSHYQVAPGDHRPTLDHAPAVVGSAAP